MYFKSGKTTTPFCPEYSSTLMYFDDFDVFWCILCVCCGCFTPPQHPRDVTPFYGTMDLYKSKRSTEASQCRGSWGSLEFTERILDKIDDLNLCLQKKETGNQKKSQKKLVGFPKKTTTLFLTLSMEEIPNNHLGCIKPCKDWDRLPINWCRISSINSIFLWVHRGIAEYFSD